VVDGRARPEAVAHAGACPTCGQEVARLRALLARLRAAEHDIAPERDLWPAVSGRLPGRRGPRWAALLRVAAAVLLFTGGVATGREMSRGTQRTVPDLPADPAARIQRTGSEYVASLASADVTVPAVRETALSTLYGAVYQMNRTQDLDAAVAAVARRLQADPATPLSTIRF
jgi:hypothetical protein